MPERSKSFISNTAVVPAVSDAGFTVATSTVDVRKGRAWAEILLALGLLELVFWTPRSPLHTGCIVALIGSVLWLGLRGRSREELGFRWPARGGTVVMLAVGCVVAAAIPLVVVAGGHPIPANTDWPKLNNLWPYVIWAVGQQFLLQSYFYVRFEQLLGGRAAVAVSSVLFALLHFPNLPLTGLTLVGGLFFTETFRTYRSLYPLAIAHALMGIAIAYSFPDSLMHHMRVGLSYWKF
ncbi:MAG TPA: CPBP family intramembrane glutamic endopeptidase [Terriglobales bacterium]|nr:CPBP family intramembrane glutamic endopeptidase [Terriglobales bacterium]